MMHSGGVKSDWRSISELSSAIDHPAKAKWNETARVTCGCTFLYYFIILKEFLTLSFNFR